MKRSEPEWKRKAAREHCKAQRDAIWDTLAGRPFWATKASHTTEYLPFNVWFDDDYQDRDDDDEH